MFVEYFSHSNKRKLQENFRKLKQGNRTVREYEREFTHLVNCAPDVARTEQDKTECFVHGLWPDIFRTVHAFKFHTFAKVLDRALWVEHGHACAWEERKTFEKDKGRKRPGGGSGGQSGSKMPPKYPKRQSKSCSPLRCVICGGEHRPLNCKHKAGRCFKCGQAGHIGR